MPTPKYPRNVITEIGDLRAAQAGIQTAGQSRVPYTKASQGLWFPDQPSDPAAPASGVILYAKGGHFYAREADGSVHQLTS